MELMDSSNIKHWSRTRLLEITGNDMGVNGVVVKNKQEEGPINLNLDGVFVYMSGSKPITDFLWSRMLFPFRHGNSCSSKTTKVEECGFIFNWICNLHAII